MGIGDKIIFISGYNEQENYIYKNNFFNLIVKKDIRLIYITIKRIFFKIGKILIFNMDS